MRLIKRWYYKLFPTYRRLELAFLNYKEADDLIRANEGKAEWDRWELAREEDANSIEGFVFMERKIRIWQ